MYTLQNDKLRIGVKKTGAELCQISSVKNNNEFMWHANPNIWGSYAPNLFPIIGALKNNTYQFEDQEYTLTKHGFIRNNDNIFLHEQTENKLTFKLEYTENTLKAYPFKFEFFITYKLTDNHIEVIHKVNNLDDKTMYFSLGGHPAFKCPIYDHEYYDNYYLEFEHNENAVRHLLNLETGLITSQTKPVFNNNNILRLTHELFNEDALVFKNLKSRKVALKSDTHDTILTVWYDAFSHLGIWAKPSGNYVCIEPWLGIADNENTNQDLKTKEGIISVNANECFTASYSIEIDNNHLD
jgi:galactose mutarotase-like enzyme